MAGAASTKADETSSTTAMTYGDVVRADGSSMHRVKFSRRQIPFAVIASANAGLACYVGASAFSHFGDATDDTGEGILVTLILAFAGITLLVALAMASCALHAPRYSDCGFTVRLLIACCVGAAPWALALPPLLY